MVLKVPVVVSNIDVSQAFESNWLSTSTEGAIFQGDPLMIINMILDA